MSRKTDNSHNPMVSWSLHLKGDPKYGKGHETNWPDLPPSGRIGLRLKLGAPQTGTVNWVLGNVAKYPQGPAKIVQGAVDMKLLEHRIKAYVRPNDPSKLDVLTKEGEFLFTCRRLGDRSYLHWALPVTGLVRT